MGTELDPGVLAAARAGAGWAFEQVFRTLAPAVHGYLRAQGATDAESAVNDVFLRVHRGLRSFDGDARSFRSWVFVIAHNYVADERRRLRRRPPVDPVPDVPDAPGVAPGAEDLALTHLAGARLRAVLDSLSPDQRDVLLLRYVADLSLEQVAEATGRTVTAVKALQRRALDALRRRLQPVPVPDLADLPLEPVSRGRSLALTRA